MNWECMKTISRSGVIEFTSIARLNRHLVMQKQKMQFIRQSGLNVLQCNLTGNPSAYLSGQSHVSSMNNLRVASQLQSYPSHIAYVYLELHL